MIYNEEDHYEREESVNSPEKVEESGPFLTGQEKEEDADIQSGEPEVEPNDLASPTPPPPLVDGAEPENEETRQTSLPQTPPSAGIPEGQSSPKPAEEILWAPKFFRGKRWETVNAELMDLPFVETAVQKMQVAPVVVALAFFALVICFVLYGIGGQVVCTLLGIAFPAFESFKAVEEFANMSDQSQLYQRAASMQFWLTYWIVAAAINSAECMFYYLVVWIPFYYPMKLVFLLYLFLPRTRGANRVYHMFVSPFLKRNRHKIDATLEESGEKVRKSLSRAASGAIDVGLGAGQSGVATLRRSVSAVGPGIQTVRTLVNAEIARRRVSTSTSDVNEKDE